MLGLLRGAAQRVAVRRMSSLSEARLLGGGAGVRGSGLLWRGEEVMRVSSGGGARGGERRRRRSWCVGDEVHPGARRTFSGRAALPVDDGHGDEVEHEVGSGVAARKQRIPSPFRLAGPLASAPRDVSAAACEDGKGTAGAAGEGRPALSFGQRLALTVHSVLRRLSPKFVKAQRASAVWNVVEMQSARPEFFEFCGIEPSFRGRLAVLTLHIWMLKHTFSQLPGDGEAGRHMLAMLFERLWEHTDQGLHNEGIHAMMLSKYVREAQQRVFGACAAYDYSFGQLETEGRGPFYGALFRNVYYGDDNMDTAQLDQLLDYMLASLEHLRQVPADNLFEGEMVLAAPPDDFPSVEAERPDIEAYKEPIVTPDMKITQKNKFHKSMFMSQWW